MIDWIKAQWEWITLGILAIIAIAASKKRDSQEIVSKGDSELGNQRSKKIAADQADIYENHIAKKSLAQKEFETKVEEIAGTKQQRIKELENNPAELDNILKEKYNLKGE